MKKSVGPSSSASVPISVGAPVVGPGGVHLLQLWLWPRSRPCMAAGRGRPQGTYDGGGNELGDVVPRQGRQRRECWEEGWARRLEFEDVGPSGRNWAFGGLAFLYFNLFYLKL
jgi:hypothetical protein